MNILLAWLITSAEFLLIDTASILRIFKDLADQGFKINYEKFNEFYEHLKDENSKDYFIKMFVPFYNFYRTYIDIQDYNNLHPYLIKEMYTLGLLENMSDFEFQEYQKNPSIINAIIVPPLCAKRLENAFVWELKDSEYPSTIWFELGKKKNLEAIEILQVTGPLAHLKPEEQKKAIESHILEDSIEKSIQMLIASQKLTKEEEEIVKCIYQELLAETKEDSKAKEESSLSLTRKKK